MSRKLRNVSAIDRLSVGEEYIKNMSLFLSRKRNISEEDARIFIESIIQQNLKTPDMDIIETLSPGQLQRKKISFKQFTNIIKDNIVTPSGSVYIGVNKKRSLVSSLIRDGLKQRDIVKKKMFKAIADGNMEDAEKYKAEQNAIKIKLNALPGGFGSPSNLFYDKGGYNAITSTARMLISNSFTCCEQFLSGNLPLFNIDEIYNLITLCIRFSPSKEAIDNIVQKYNLYRVTKEDVLNYLQTQISMYNRNINLVQEGISDYLDSVDDHILQFIFYHSNLKHIITKNETLFRSIISNIFKYDLNCKIDEDITSDMFYSCNGDVMAIVTTILSDYLKDIKIKDIVEKNKEEAIFCVQICRNIEKILNNISDIFEIFIYHDMNFQVVLHRSNMQRKSVVVSDTDSVIYTTREWAEWYTKSSVISKDSYNISALVTYWLTEANADVMAKYIIGIGATGSDIPTIKMKNEFLYPSLLLFDIKKVYAGIIKIQEGVMLPEPKPDVKGASLRGVGASIPAKEFTKKLLVDKILKEVAENTLSAENLINEVLSFEKKIYTSLAQGNIEYAPIVSVGTEDSYENSDISSYFYAKAWNYIFGKKYGEIKPPDKLPLIKLIKPTELYFEQLKQIDVDIYNRFKKFIEENKKWPPAIFIEPNVEKIPEELMPIINYRDIIYFNVAPTYLVLSSLNIEVGYKDKNLLLGDIYG